MKKFSSQKLPLNIHLFYKNNEQIDNQEDYEEPVNDIDYEEEDDYDDCEEEQDNDQNFQIEIFNQNQII